MARLLQRHGLRPYAVYLTAAGLTTSQRRDRSRASLELLTEAREQAIGQLRTSMCAQQGRARGLLAEAPDASDPIPVYRDVLARFLRIQRTLPQLELGAPIVYGVEAVGDLADVRAARSDPAVVSFEPGWRTGGTEADSVIVPQPPGSTGAGAPPTPDSTVSTPEQVRAQILQLADNGMGACIGATGP